MTIKDALSFATSQLNPTSLKLRGTRKIDSCSASWRIDAAILLSAAIKKPKEFLYTYPEKKLTAAQIAKFKNFIRRRAAHEPIAYITGKKEFYGFEFLVTPAVLIPRPDTETLISTVLSTVGSFAPYSYPHHFALELSKATRCKQIIIDVGTGSGAIAVTLKKILPKTQVFASDISSSALNLAKKNARRLKADIIFKKGDLLSPLLRHPALDAGSHGLIITANIPYLSRAEWQNCQPEVKKYEPYGALVGGKTGTEIYEKLFKEISSSLWPVPQSPEGDVGKREAGRDLLNPPRSSFSEGGRIILFLEIGYNQKPAITKLAKKILHPQKIEFFKDLAGKWRVAKIAI